MKVIKSEVLKNNKISSDDVVVKTDNKKGKLLTNCFKKEILLVKKTSKQNLNINFQNVLFDQIEINTDKLEYQNGVITVKSGVKKVKISGHIFAENAFNAYLFGFLRKNNDNLQEYICEGTQNFKELNVSSYITNVNEGDNINLNVQINKADYGQIRSGYLCVEILE